jgi:hypothetical protein
MTQPQTSEEIKRTQMERCLAIRSLRQKIGDRIYFLEHGRVPAPDFNPLTMFDLAAHAQ